MAKQEEVPDSPPPGNYPSWLPPTISAIIPGGGQLYLGYSLRGIGLFVGMALLIGLVLWMEATVLLALVMGIWLWNIWDAYKLSSGHRTRVAIPILLAVIIVYGLGVIITDVQPRRMVTGWQSMMPYLRALTRPELLAYPTEDRTGTSPFQVPCIDPLPDPGADPSTDPTLTPDVPCAAVDEQIQISGEGYFPNFEGEFWWRNPIGDPQRIIVDGQPQTFVTDARGRFSATITVPLAVPISQLPAEGETQTHTILAEQHRPYGQMQPTETLRLVIEKIGETVALAFLATVLGVIFAIPVSFLAARNLMWGSPITRAIYYVVRTLLNIIRSIETLMWAIIFAVWVGLGPFGGMLALWFHTVAALGKLYSEAIESIDPGPIEAVRSTGANQFQVIVYAVLPQILPTFASFTLYRWDINVRMSTVIGLVSDAGLGFLVIQWIRLNRFSAMATALIAIMIVVASIDWISSKLRQRILAGTPSNKKVSPARRWITRSAIVVGFILAFIWSWNVAQVRVTELARGAPQGLNLAASFAAVDLITRPTKEISVTQDLPVPCGVADSTSERVESGPRLNLSRSCGDVGDPLTITGHGLPPETLVSIRWVLPDGAFLRVKSNCCTTDAAGTVRLDTTISPLLEVDEETAQSEGVGQVSISWKEVIGGPQPSDALKRVLKLAMVTLLMALLATTIGAFFAIPLSFFAARNIMGDSRLGRTTYTVFRTAFNLFRSIEPMLLVLVCAAWVGAGPFAGVLALALNNIPNLGKLFSESIEEIEEGPVEAVTTTGASKLQVLVFAIAPQLVTSFLAFILYQWDINIRMSTVIGFVGGGGIGQQFRIWVGLNQYDAAGVAILAIILMVWTMDYISAKARENLI